MKKKDCIHGSVSLELCNPFMKPECVLAGQIENGRIHHTHITNDSVVKVLEPSLGQFPDHSCLSSAMSTETDHACVQHFTCLLCYSSDMYPTLEHIGRAFLKFAKRSLQGASGETIMIINSCFEDRRNRTRYLELDR